MWSSSSAAAFAGGHTAPAFSYEHCWAGMRGYAVPRERITGTSPLICIMTRAEIVRVLEGLLVTGARSGTGQVRPGFN